jgi:hypothetical protein
MSSFVASASQRPILLFCARWMGPREAPWPVPSLDGAAREVTENGGVAEKMGGELGENGGTARMKGGVREGARDVCHRVWSRRGRDQEEGRPAVGALVGCGENGGEKAVGVRV